MSDSRLVTWAARSYFDELLEAGVRIFEYGPRMLHTKAFVADEEVCIVGSANFDNRSFRLNFELSMMFRDRQLTGELAGFLSRRWRRRARCASTATARCGARACPRRWRGSPHRCCSASGTWNRAPAQR